MKLRYDPADVVGVDESQGMYSVTIVSRDADRLVTLRRHNTQESAEEHAEQVRSVLATWLEV